MLSKAYCEERRSLWYNNGRTNSKLSMASRDFTIDTRWNLMTNTMSLSSTISSVSHSYILWRILTRTKKLFARLQVEHWQGHVAIPIVMDRQLEVCKARINDINQRTNYLSEICRMDLPGPTTSVGTRTDYSVGPWDYLTCVARYPMAWSTSTTEEKYSVRKLYMSRTV
jgi:hypothetical protein